MAGSPVADCVHDLGRRDHDRVDVGEVGDRRHDLRTGEGEIIASSKTAHSVVCRGRQAGRVTVTALIVATAANTDPGGSSQRGPSLTCRS